MGKRKEKCCSIEDSMGVEYCSTGSSIGSVVKKGGEERREWGEGRKIEGKERKEKEVGE